MKRYLDYDRNKKIFYDNYYIDEFDMVVKVPIAIASKIKQNFSKKVQFEKFHLTGYAYLLHYN